MRASSWTRDSGEGAPPGRSLPNGDSGSLPEFPLPLGDLSVPCRGDMSGVVAPMDPQQTQRFEIRVCRSGRRFHRVGVFGLRWPRGTRVDRRRHLFWAYSSKIPAGCRRSLRHRVRYATGLIPVTVADCGPSFNDAALAARTSLDWGSRSLAEVPFERVSGIGAVNEPTFSRSFPC